MTSSCEAFLASIGRSVTWMEPALTLGALPPPIIAAMPLPALAPTVVSVSRTSGNRRKSAAIRSRIVVVAASPEPSGARTVTWNSDRSSVGVKPLPIAWNSGTMLPITRTQTMTITHRCAIDQRSIAM